jgi:hypothetical protein
MPTECRLLTVPATYLLIFSICRAEPNKLLADTRKQFGNIQMDDAFSTQMKMFHFVQDGEELHSQKKSYPHDRWFDKVHSFYTKEELFVKLDGLLYIPLLQHDKASFKGQKNENIVGLQT